MSKSEVDRSGELWMAITFSFSGVVLAYFFALTVPSTVVPSIPLVPRYVTTGGFYAIGMAGIFMASQIVGVLLTGSVRSRCA